MQKNRVLNQRLVNNVELVDGSIFHKTSTIRQVVMTQTINMTDKIPVAYTAIDRLDTFQSFQR